MEYSKATRIFLDRLNYTMVLQELQGFLLIDNKMQNFIARRNRLTGGRTWAEYQIDIVIFFEQSVLPVIKKDFQVRIQLYTVIPRPLASDGRRLSALIEGKRHKWERTNPRHEVPNSGESSIGIVEIGGRE